MKNQPIAKINEGCAVYIHIPFCDAICSYCDFPKVLKETNYVNRYLQALFAEMDSVEVPKVKTIYIGGGTPSALSAEDLERLLKYISNKFNEPLEYTIEANPESLSEDKIKLLKKYGVNRVSLGVQTFNNELLTLLNRQHDFTMVEQVVSNLKKNEINSINLDFIYGIPGQTFECLQEDVQKAIDLSPNHLSFYSLQIEPGTVLGNMKVLEPSEEELAKDYEYIVKTLKENGYERYEVSNFSKPGYESLHNLTYWHNDEYYAFGLGATSFIDGERISRTHNILKYMEGDYFNGSEKEENYDPEFDFLMLNLRLEKGFLLSEFTKRTCKDFLHEYEEEIEKLRDYLSISRSRVRIKPQYMYVLDSILVDLLHFSN